jgi:hypothetical protein
MPGRRSALLIVTSSYVDPAFRRLRAPVHDATALSDVLRDPEIGGYSVEILPNKPSHQVRLAVNRLFAEAKSDDLILLYVSGHGVKDVSGELHFAVRDTQRGLLAATGVPARFVRDLIDESPARKVVVWLDCCYAGAFPSGMASKASGDVDVLSQLKVGSGRGCAVMTASTHIQFAYEPGGTTMVKGTAEPSVFTQAIVEGLRTGDADLNSDGEVDASELYSYVYEHVRKRTPEQTPTRNDRVTGELYIAHSHRGVRLHPDLPVDLSTALRSRFLSIRLGAVSTLGELATDGDWPAKHTLQALGECGDEEITIAAKNALASVINPMFAVHPLPTQQPNATLASSGPIEPPPSRSRPWWHATVAYVSIILLIGAFVLALDQYYWRPDTDGGDVILTFAGGNTPQETDCATDRCIEGVIHSYKWQAATGIITSSFRGPPTAHKFNLSIHYDPGTCPGATLSWSWHMRDSVLERGFLGENSEHNLVRISVPANARLLLTATRRGGYPNCKSSIVVDIES